MDQNEPIEPWDDLEAQQILLEREAAALARGKADEGAGRGVETETEILRRYLTPLERRIADFTAEGVARPKMQRPAAALLLDKFEDPAAAAFLTLRLALGACASGGSLTALAAEIGARLEDELRLRRLRRAERRLFDALERRARPLSSYKARRSVFLRVAAQAGMETAERWSVRERTLLGVKLIDLAAEATGLLEITLAKTRKGPRIISRRVVEASPSLTAAIAGAASRAALLKAERPPMVCRPAPWKGVSGGGYVTAQLPALSLVKTRSAAHKAELESMRAPSVFSAINAAQNTAWRVNRRILALQSQCMEDGESLGGLPALTPAPRPEPPADLEQNAPGRTSWRRAMRLWREEERRRSSRLVAFALAQATARRYSRFDRLYLPHQYDFRGRLYPATRLSPQSPDAVRALLEFGEGRPLGEEGWKWLAIHLANCGDFQKISKAPLAERVRWVFRNEERIRSVAADPRADLWWCEADQPWQFLAACLEWADYVEMIEREGEATANARFASHLPVALDGSCSGLQHFSMMLRDELGGAAVNLSPKAESADLYLEVAERVRARLEKDCKSARRFETGGESFAVSALAKAWLEFGVGRALVKRPTMTYGYGARRFGYVEQIVNDALAPRRAEALEGRASWPFAGDDLLTPAAYLADHVAEAIEATVVKAAEAMGWLQALAAEASKRDLPLRWTTPDGFVVLQAYRETKKRMIHTTLSGRVLRLSLREEGEQLDRRRQRMGVAPNVIHSLDACHLRLTVAQAVKEGIQSFALVHDSFGAHAADTPRFFQIIREAMVVLYEETDVPSALNRDLGQGLPEKARAALAPPSAGNLSLGGVLESEFAFA